MPSVTPFFADFHRRLFGKAPLSALQELLRSSPQSPAISHYQELFGKLVPQELLAPQQRGPNSRQRVFSSSVTFWSFLAQVLEPGSSCRDALRQLNAWWQWHYPHQAVPSHDTSAYCQARARLSESTLQTLVNGWLSNWNNPSGRTNSGWGAETKSSMALQFRCPIRRPISGSGHKARRKSRAAVFRCLSWWASFLCRAVQCWGDPESPLRWPAKTPRL